MIQSSTHFWHLLNYAPADHFVTKKSNMMILNYIKFVHLGDEQSGHVNTTL